MGKEAAGAAKELRSREEFDRDLNKVIEQLASLLEEEHQRRLALLKRNEEIEREAVDEKVEINRLENMQEQLTHQLASLNEQRVELEGTSRRLQREFDDLSGQDNALREENEKLSAERARLEEEVSRLRKLHADYIAAIAKFKGQKEGT